MIIYGNDQNYYNNSFIVKKLNKLNIYWNYKMFTDHLSLMESIKMAKSLAKDKVIFLSLESGVHSYKYWRPYSLSDFNISHKNVKNSIYYNLFAEDYLNGFLKKKIVYEKKYDKPIFIASNISKINYVQNLMGVDFSNINFYGSFNNKVDDVEGNFHLNAQHLIGQHKSAICVENSEETGYIQGNFLFSLLSGTVPIIKASKYILKNILVPECYVKLSDYCSMSKKEKIDEVNKRSDFILNDKEVFTTLTKDYLDFIKEINLSDISLCVSESQEFKKRIFEL